MPFDEINNQINSNYCEIQTRTTKIVIDRLGLGTGILKTSDATCQTEEE